MIRNILRGRMSKVCLFSGFVSCLQIVYPLFQSHYICNLSLPNFSTLCNFNRADNSNGPLPSTASMSWQHAVTTPAEPQCAGWGPQPLVTPLYFTTHIWLQVRLASASPVHVSAQTLFATKSLERNKDEEIDFNLLTAVPLHRRQYGQLMKQNLKVNPWRIPSSPTFLLSYPRLWICALPLLQLITSSGSISQGHGQWPPELCFFFGSHTMTTKIYFFSLRYFFQTAFKLVTMESGGRNSEPFVLATASFHVTQLSMLLDGYVVCSCCPFIT